MSLENPDPRPRQVEDIVPVLKIALVAFSAVILFGVGTVWAGWIWIHGMRVNTPTGPAPIPAQVGQLEQGIVFQRPFDQTALAQKLHDEAMKHLDSYGWVDRSSGMIHVPIAGAMDRMAAGETP